MRRRGYARHPSCPVPHKAQTAKFLAAARASLMTVRPPGQRREIFIRDLIEIYRTCGILGTGSWLLVPLCRVSPSGMTAGFRGRSHGCLGGME